MELLIPPQKRRASEKTYNSIVKKISEVLKNSPGDEDVKKAIIAFYKTYADARYRNLELQELWDMRGEMSKIKKQFPGKVKDIENLASILHFELRDQIDFALRFPIYYMDVHPEGEENMTNLYESICSRNSYVEKNLRPHIRDTNKFKIPEIPKIGIDCKTGANPKINLEIVKYEKKLAADIFAELPKGVHEKSVDFVFDCSRKANIFPRDSDTYWIDFEKFAKIVKWYEPGAPKGLTGEYNQVMYLNQKIVDWLYGDVIVYVLELIHLNQIKTKMSIWIPFYNLTTCSYLFGRIGSLTCDMNVKLVFNNLTGSAFKFSRDIQNIDINDIQSVLAVYFETSHEIWRANVPPNSYRVPVLLDKQDNPKSIVNTMTPAGNPLYFKIMECWEYGGSIIDNIPKADDAELNKFCIDFIDKYPNKHTGTRLRMLIAPPGTGKTTYNKLYNSEHIIVDTDEISENLEIKGKTIKSVNEEYKLKLSDFINNKIPSQSMEILRKVLTRSIFIKNRKRRISVFRDVSRKCVEIILKKCAEYKFNVCIENPGFITHKQPKYNSCGLVSYNDNIEAQNFTSTWCNKFTCEIIILYLNPINQYNQQLFRVLDHERLTRYYTLMNFNDLSWGELQNTISNKINIYGYNDFDLIPIIINGELADNYQEIKKEIHIVPKFERFLKLLIKNIKQ